MQLHTSALYYGSVRSPFELPAEWNSFPDRADIDLDALCAAMERATGALSAREFRKRASLKHVDAIDVRSAGKHIHIAARTVVMGSGFTVSWFNDGDVDFIKDIVEA